MNNSVPETVTIPVVRRAILNVVKDRPTVRVLQEACFPQMAVIMMNDGRIGMVSPEYLTPSIFSAGREKEG